MIKKARRRPISADRAAAAVKGDASGKTGRAARLRAAMGPSREEIIGGKAASVSKLEPLYVRRGRRFKSIGAAEVVDGKPDIWLEHVSTPGDWLNIVERNQGYACRLKEDDMITVMRWLPRLTWAITEAIQELQKMPVESDGWKKMPARERRAWAAYRKALGFDNKKTITMTGRALHDAVEEGIAAAIKRWVLHDEEEEHGR